LVEVVVGVHASQRFVIKFTRVVGGGPAFLDSFRGLDKWVPAVVFVILEQLEGAPAKSWIATMAS
jgi:hypothetical protein